MKLRCLVFDIGNTHSVIGVYVDGSLAHSWRLATDKRRTEDEHFCLLSDLLRNAGVRVGDFDICALASVVPDLTRVFSRLVEKYVGCQLVVVNGYTNLGLRFPMPDPGFIGADLIVNAYAAWRKYQRPCAVCDFGTATTIQLTDAEGFYIGAVIIPGLLSSASSLFDRAALLAHIELESPETLLGVDTRGALQSGILNGAAFMLDGFLTRIRAEYAHLGPIHAIGTGGIAPLVCGLSETINCVDRTLTLDGLHLICQRFHTA